MRKRVDIFESDSICSFRKMGFMVTLALVLMISQQFLFADIIIYIFSCFVFIFSFRFCLCLY